MKRREYLAKTCELKCWD